MKITDISSSPISEDKESVEVENNKQGSSKKQTLLEKFKIPIEHLDFDYITKCNNSLEIERILRILRSGEEGTYPELETCVVQRLEKLKPSSRLLRVQTAAPRTKELGGEERKDLVGGLEEWLSSMETPCPDLDKSIFESTTQTHEEFPLPVRGSNNHKVVELKDQNFTNKTVNKDRIKSWEYDKWDKFDVDAELTKFDITDMQVEEWEKRGKPKVIEEQKKVEKLMRSDECSGKKQSNPAPQKPSSSSVKKEKKGQDSTSKKANNLGRSFIEEIDDDEEGVRITRRPTCSSPSQSTHQTRIVIDDLNLRV